MYSKIPIAKRYSKALFKLSNEKNVSEQVLSDLLLCNEKIENNKNLSKTLFNHYTPIKLQRELMEFLDKKNNFNELTSNFLKILTKNNRCYILPEVLDSYRNLVAKSKNEIIAMVQSPCEIGDDVLAKLKLKLEQRTQKNIVTKVNINKNLSAGIIITFENKMLDYSLESKYKNILNLCQPT